MAYRASRAVKSSERTRWSGPWLWLVVGLAALALSSTLARTADASGPIKRDILGLYDGRDEKRADQTRLHRLLEMPLNHLGYRLDLHDISKSLPAPALVARYHAVATWFSGGVGETESYLAWAADIARAGTRFVILESVGALGSADEIPKINAFLTELGLAYAPFYVSDSRGTRIDKADPPMLDFEHVLNRDNLPGHQVIAVTSGTIAKHLTVTDPNHKWVEQPESVLVSTGPRGGLIAAGYATHYDATLDRVSWIVDPFRFLEAALGRQMWPIPDTTTVAGRRLYFSHVDGDGWLKSTGTSALAGDILIERLIAPYPDLPVTVGLIAGDISTPHGGHVETGILALKLFEPRQVEIASHTYTHPYRWSAFETYDRERELDQIKRYVAAGGTNVDPRVAALVRDRQTSLLFDETGAFEDATGLARARVLVPFDVDLEVTEALRVSQQLAPVGKPVRVYMWSGDKRPFEAALRLVRENGAKNLNGRESRFDTAFPSVAYVSPLGRKVGVERQVYAVNSSEKRYTDGWRGPADGFKRLTETLDNTERPRRLKGFNLYYHMHSATRPEGLAVIESHLALARRSRIAPIAASEYVAIVEGFFSAEIDEIGPLRWRVSNRGDLDTVRFENAASFEVDDKVSRGVVGSKSEGDVLYVTLDAEVETATVGLQKVAPARTATRGSRRVPHLEESRWRVRGVTRGGCGLMAEMQGFGPAEMTWRGFPQGVYDLSLRRQGQTLASSRVNVDASGIFNPPPVDVSAIEPVVLEVTCVKPSLDLGGRSTAAGKKRAKREQIRADANPGVGPPRNRPQRRER